MSTDETHSSEVTATDATGKMADTVRNLAECVKSTSDRDAKSRDDAVGALVKVLQQQRGPQGSTQPIPDLQALVQACHQSGVRTFSATGAGWVNIEFHSPPWSIRVSQTIELLRQLAALGKRT